MKILLSEESEKDVKTDVYTEILHGFFLPPIDGVSVLS